MADGPVTALRRAGLPPQPSELARWLARNRVTAEEAYELGRRAAADRCPECATRRSSRQVGSALPYGEIAR